jgi:hypothetical protein
MLMSSILRTSVQAITFVPFMESVLPIVLQRSE